MSIDKQGFLRPQIPAWIQKHRLENRDWLSLAEQLDQVAHRQRAGMQVPLGDNRLFLAALLFMRGLSHLESAIILAERGLTKEVRTLARNSFEVVFCLGALLNDNDIVDLLISDDLGNRKKNRAKGLQKISPGNSGLEAEHKEKLENFLSSLEETGTDCSTKSVEGLARTAGLEDIYNTYYRGLSNDSGHTSIVSLNHYIEANLEGIITGLHWGPDVRDVGETLQAVCTAYIYLIDLTNQFFGFTDISEGFERNGSLYKSLIQDELDKTVESQKILNGESFR